MNAGFKLGLAGLVISSTISIVFGVLEIKKTRRMHKQDIKMIVDGVVSGIKDPEDNKNLEPQV